MDVHMTRPFLLKQEVRRWCGWCERRASSSTPTSGQWSTFPLSSSSSWCAMLAAWLETVVVGSERLGPSAPLSSTWEQGKLAEKRVGTTENKVMVTCLPLLYLLSWYPLWESKVKVKSYIKSPTKHHTWSSAMQNWFVWDKKKCFYKAGSFKLHFHLTPGHLLMYLWPFPLLINSKNVEFVMFVMINLLISASVISFSARWKCSSCQGCRHSQ